MITEPDYDTYGDNAAVDDVDVDVAGGLRIRFRRRAKNTLGWVITVPNDVTPYNKNYNYYNALSCFFVSCFIIFFSFSSYWCLPAGGPRVRSAGELRIRYGSRRAQNTFPAQGMKSILRSCSYTLAPPLLGCHCGGSTEPLAVA